MKVYLAAAFCRKEEILEVAHQLEELGITVTSRWLTEQKDVPTDTSKSAFLAERAQIDLDDIDRADVLVRFSDDLSSPTVPSHLATGSRMGETLYARCRHKDIIIVGGHQCVFDYLPDIYHVKNVEEMKSFLVARIKLARIFYDEYLW
jgi:hypothetical protein